MAILSNLSTGGCVLPLLIHQCVFDGLQLALQRPIPLSWAATSFMPTTATLIGIDAVAVDAVRWASIAAMVAAMTAAMAEIAAATTG